MGWILLDLGQGGYRLLSVPERISEHAQAYQAEFDKWIMNPESEHPYWTRDGEGNAALCYDGAEAFAEWLNRFVLKDTEEKAVLVPVLHF